MQEALLPVSIRMSNAIFKRNLPALGVEGKVSGAERKKLRRSVMHLTAHVLVGSGSPCISLMMVAAAAARFRFQRRHAAALCTHVCTPRRALEKLLPAATEEDIEVRHPPAPPLQQSPPAAPSHAGSALPSSAATGAAAGKGRRARVRQAAGPPRGHLQAGRRPADPRPVQQGRPRAHGLRPLAGGCVRPPTPCALCPSPQRPHRRHTPSASRRPVEGVPNPVPSATPHTARRASAAGVPRGETRTALTGDCGACPPPPPPPPRCARARRRREWCRRCLSSTPL